MTGVCRYVTYLKEELHPDLLKNWEKHVVPLFESHGMYFELFQNKCTMVIVETAEEHNFHNMRKGQNILSALSYGLSTDWVEPILNGSIHILVFPLSHPYITEEEFDLNYDNFMDMFDDYNLLSKWNCLLLYGEKEIVILATTEIVKIGVSNIVSLALLRNYPLEKNIVNWISTIEGYEKESIKEKEELFVQLCLSYVPLNKKRTTVEESA